MSAMVEEKMTTARGLKGVVIGPSTISYVDGENGRLIYRGYSIEELAEHSTFEEVSFLLWHGRLPKRAELGAIRKELASEFQIPAWIAALIRQLPPSTHPMDVLRTAVSALSGDDPLTEKTGFEFDLKKAVKLTAKAPTIVAAYDRIRKGKDPIPPDPTVSMAANFLQMLHGRPPSPEVARALDVILILHADHGFNASTFAARVTVSTQSDMYAGVTSALGTLKGPLHGGANQKVREMLGEIREPSNAAQYVKDRLAVGGRIMGFGHRVYKTTDPRSNVLRDKSRILGEATGNPKLYRITQALEEVMKLEKGGKLPPNVDLYSASCYEYLGIDTDLNTSMFAIGRMPGWTAHVIEQLGDNQLIRPLADYQGERNLTYVPPDKRE
jgi:citrate synthase